MKDQLLVHAQCVLQAICQAIEGNLKMSNYWYNFFLMRHVHNVQCVTYGHYQKYFKLSLLDDTHKDDITSTSSN